MSNTPNTPDQRPDNEFAERDRWQVIRESRTVRGELAKQLDVELALRLEAKKTKTTQKQPKRLKDTPKYQAWTKYRRTHAMPGMIIKIQLNLACLGNTAAIQQAWAPLEEGPWTVVRHTDQRLLCRHPLGNEIWVNKECGHTTKYIWDIVKDQT